MTCIQFVNICSHSTTQCCPRVRWAPAAIVSWPTTVVSSGQRRRPPSSITARPPSLKLSSAWTSYSGNQLADCMWICVSSVAGSLLYLLLLVFPAVLWSIQMLSSPLSRFTAISLKPILQHLHQRIVASAWNLTLIPKLRMWVQVPATLLSYSLSWRRNLRSFSSWLQRLEMLFQWQVRHSKDWWVSGILFIQSFPPKKWIMFYFMVYLIGRLSSPSGNDEYYTNTIGARIVICRLKYKWPLKSSANNHKGTSEMD